MRNIGIIFKREMMAYFYSPIAYIVGLCFLAAMGCIFNLIIAILSGEDMATSYTPMDWFFNGIFTWIIILIMVPVITMRLFAEEKKTGILEGIMTTPLTDTEYVLGKYFSALTFYVLLWVPTFSYVYILRTFAQDTTPLDLGPIIGGYTGCFLVGMLLTAVGCMASTLTRNQIIASIIAFAVGALLFLGGIYFYIRPTSPSRELLESISMMSHMQEFSRGLIDVKRVVFYLTGTAFFLFLTHRMVQSRHWTT